MERQDVKTFIEISGAERRSERELDILRTRWNLRRRQRGRKRHRK